MGSFVTPGIERLSLDLPRAVKNIECALEVGCLGKMPERKGSISSDSFHGQLQGY